MEKQNYDLLKGIALNNGASLFGASRVDWDKTEYLELTPEVVRSLNSAISMAVRLSSKVLEDIKDCPAKLYLHHYKQVNYMLDRLALLVTNAIQEKGFAALPIPASGMVDWQAHKGHVSHRKFAAAAGLGWRGRNNLLVTPQYGARVRLITVLTDIPLTVDKPLEQDCGQCRKCIQACPSSSIKESVKDFDAVSCYNQLDSFRKKGAVSQHICGICVKTCQP